MFNPSQEQVRLFFIEVWQKAQQKALLTDEEKIALSIILDHPEYHVLLENKDKALSAQYTPESGQLNPFLHLSLHLAIEEQLSIDQPAGLKSAFEQCQKQLKDRHQSMHIILESLGEILHEAQRNHCPPDGLKYVERIMQRITKH